MVKISSIQFSPVWAEKSKNLQAIRQLMCGLDSDIIVLPELCTTGYSFLTKEEAFDQAEDLSGETAQFFRALAVENKTMIIAGFAEKGKTDTYNSALVALPDGSLKVYRKTHLFYKETLCFAPGDSGFFVVKHPFVDCRVGVMVCNDWRYPEAARSLGLVGADVIACPSNLVSNLWGVAMPARALENKVYLAVANRCGTEKRPLPDGSEQVLTFNGGSIIYNFNGAVLSQAGVSNDQVVTVSIDPVITRDKSFNAFNDLFRDRRPPYYITS